MDTIVIYKSKYGSTKAYAEHIATALGCEAKNASDIQADALLQYDTIIYGGGLYSNSIAGVSLITKRYDKLKDKKLIVFSTALTPADCTAYYDDLVAKKHFTEEMLAQIKWFRFPGKMLQSELTIPHKMAIAALKKLMSGKENPTEMEKLLIQLCDVDADLTDLNLAEPLIQYAKE